MNVPKFSLLVALMVGAGLSGLQAETLTYKDLVHRLYDLDHLAVPPQLGENGALASSYDRGSKYDAATDKYINWGANGDGGGIIRQEGDQSVLAEIKGPGVIWRTWAATPKEGHVKIYLDGAATPAVDLPFTSYFDHSVEPFTRANIVYTTLANGFDNYTPIPFQKSCKITADKGWGNYYHFNYTTFPAGTTVPTFKLPLSDEDNAALDTAEKVLSSSGDDPAGIRSGQKTETPAITVAAGEKATVADLAGEGAVTALKVRFDLPADKEAQKKLLRQLAISISWDGKKEPAVWSPLGDFFGDAIIPAHYQSLPTGILDDGTYYAYWYMPYASGAHIEVENDSPQSVAMNWEVTHASLDKPAASLLRFHAKWHRDATTPMRPDRQPDWLLLKTDGAGRYVGTQLNIWNPRGGWWGEGDEKWFVDGEKSPSTFGTGSEDYFGFAWSSGTVFNQSLHGQPVRQGDQVSVHRWHVADNIPFQKTFEGIIEKYYGNDRPTKYAAVVYWYLSADGTDPYGPVPVTERVGYWDPLVLYREPGAIEGEDIHIITKDIPANHPEMWTLGKKWSGDVQLEWAPPALGPKAHCDFELKAPQAGKYTLIAHYSHAPNYGIVQASVNGAKVGAPVDLYGDTLIAADPVELGIVDLKAGFNTFTLDVTGKNDKSRDIRVGLDYIKIVPIP
jgi:hypothetical protein